MSGPETPKSNLAQPDGGEKLPAYLEPGMLHLRMLTDKDGNYRDGQIQFRQNDKNTFVVGKTGLGGKLEPANYSPWLDSAILEVGGKTVSGNEIDYLPATSRAVQELLQNAETESLEDLVSNLTPDTELMTDEHPYHSLNASDRDQLLQIIEEILGNRG